MKPLGTQTSKTMAKLIICLIWVLSLTLASPLGFFYDLKYMQDEATGKPKAGLNYRIVDNGSNFTAGERQLLFIARAILKNNKVVVLDQIAAKLDAASTATIQKLIDEEFKGATVILISSRLKPILNCDRIIMLEKGRIAEIGTPNELL